MTGQSPWSIKGIKSGNREAAKEQAHRNGLTIGEYINSLIEESERLKSSSQRPIYTPVFDPQNANFAPQAMPQIAPQAIPQAMPMQARSPDVQAFPNFTHNQNPALQQQQTNSYDFGALQFGVNSNSETSRLAMAMEALHQKLDAVANNKLQANEEIIAKPIMQQPIIRDDMIIAEKATERAITSLLQKVEDNEHQTNRNFGQITSTLSDVRQAQETIADRLRRLEADDPSHRSIQSLRILEQSLTRLAKQITDAETRTDAIVREIENDRKNRLSPHDVERILEGSVHNLKENLNEKIGEVNGRLSSIEEIATISIEQTDKGISLLSERVRDAESLSNRTNETLKEALIDLSARLTQVEVKAPDNIKEALEAQFNGLVKRIEQIDNQVANFVHIAQRELEDKFSNLATSFDERFDANEKETLGAIENIGSHLVRTAEGLDARVKAIEEVNENAKDHHLAMRIELGRITHAIDTRLSAIENRESDGLDKTGEHLNHLAEQITNRLQEVEQKSNNFMQQMANDNRAIIESLNNNKENISSEFGRKLEDFDRRINQRLDDRFGAFNNEIKQSEDRAMAVSAPLNRSLNEILDRLENIESRNLAPYSETISPPSFDYGHSQKPVSSASINIGEKLDNSFGFGSPDAKFETAVNEEVNNPFETENDDSISSFDDGFAGDYSINDELSEPIFDITGAEAEDQDYNDWGSQKNNSDAQKSVPDYLDMARRAAIDAASNPVQKGKKPKAEKKEAKKEKIAKPPEPLMTTEAIFDEEIKISTKQKVEPQAGLSPLGKVAMGALAVATITTGYMYYQQNQAIDQNELPAALKNEAPAATIPAPPTAAPEALNAVAAAPPVNMVAPTNAVAPITPPIAPPSAPPQFVAPNAQTPAALPVQKPIEPVLKAAPPIAKPQEVAKAPQAKPIIPINPFKAFAKPAPVQTPPAPVAAKQEPIRIASVGDKQLVTPNPLPKAAPKAAPMKVDAKLLYDQALAKQKAGDVAGAVALLTRAADAGDTRSQNRLAKMYEKGDGVTKSMMEARKWTERAALAGSKQAQHNLGVYYAEGDGASQDFVKAAENFKKAAKRGLTDSQFNLGAMHEQGLGTTKSANDAYFWYSLAAKNGDADALKKINALSSKIDPKEKAAIDRKVTSFKPEAGGQE